MVSIHKVPVIVHLIIRVISSTFRFKRGLVLVTRPTFKGSGKPTPSKRATQSPRRYDITLQLANRISKSRHDITHP